jgi:hypothetical protein
MLSGDSYSKLTAPPLPLTTSLLTLPLSSHERRGREPVSRPSQFAMTYLTCCNSWRRSGQSNRQNQDTRSGNNTPARDGGRQQALSALSGNAWGPGKGKAGGGGNQGPAQATTAQAEQHVPVKDFNAAEVREFLKKSKLHPMPLVGSLECNYETASTKREYSN